MGDLAELKVKLHELSDAYAASLPNKLEQLALLRLAWSQTVWDEQGFNDLCRCVHSLAGSGSTLGFSALSAAALELDNYLKPFGADKQPLNQEQRKQMDSLLCDLHRAARQPDSAPTSLSELMAIAPTDGTTPVSRRVFVVEDDVELAEELKIQLGYFGYDAIVHTTLAGFREAIRHQPDGVVLMDVNFPEDNLGGVHVMQDLQRQCDKQIPVIFMSVNGEMEIRLEAVRAGGVAYLNKPVNIGVLIDKLDDLTSTQPVAAYRVLIVDDTYSLAAHYAAILELAGMSVRVVTDPLQVMQPLLEFLPDLILIDMYMPDCNGAELALVIRQLDAFIGIPVVFLSVETSLDIQLAAVGLGGDDFLTKPVAPRHLVTSVSNRIKRSLLLRSFMLRDSLTGLLNHTAIKDQLAREMVRAKRNKTHLSLAMVDIDHFKQVNDNYGHPVGDRVIKSLSRLLKQRLRENDLIGRYGGEEFALILVDADGPAAVEVMDGIRRDFAQLRHLAGEQEFTVTLSCGVADLEDYQGIAWLVDAADKAMYQAKHAGRNRVVLKKNDASSG